jgi:hypothetical protein
VVNGADVTQSCSLYVSHDGTTRFIASLGQGRDLAGWLPVQSPGGSSGLSQKTSRVSVDGSTVLFSSTRSLTGYDSAETGTGCGSSPANDAITPCAELFRYSAPGDELSCVSCSPVDAPTSGPAALGSESANLTQGIASSILSRNLSADGNRAFFESPDALLPADTNGVKDVYEWEAKGSGSCKSESQNGGCLYLISSGASPDPSRFGDASANGDHVFIFTSQQLVPTDRDELVDAYDAGSGAGLASQHALAPPTCASAACQANPAPPPDPPTSSATFSGPGNAKKPPAARKCPKGKRKVRSAGKVRCQKASKQHKRHSNRGGSK